MSISLPLSSLNIDFTKDGQSQGDLFPDELSKLYWLIRSNFSRASAGGRTNKLGVWESQAAGQPRLDFDLATLLCAGLLLEPPRTQLATGANSNSGDETGSSTGGQADPAGGTGATKWTQTGAGRIYFNVVCAPAAGTYAYSVWARADAPVSGVELVIALDGDTVLGSLLINLTTSWQRVSVAGYAGTSGTYLRGWVRGVNGAVIYTFGDQIEYISGQGSVGTSYIGLDTTAQLSRAADSAAITQFAPWWSDAVGTIVIDFDAANPTACLAYFFDVGRDWNHVALELDGAGNALAHLLSAGGSQQINCPGIVAGRNKVAFSMSATQLMLAVNGGTPATLPRAIFPTGINTVVIGNNTSNNQSLNGWLRRFFYSPTAANSPLTPQGLST